MATRRTGTPGLYRRCGCRNPETGKTFATLPDKAQVVDYPKACPKMADPKHGRWAFRVSNGFDANGKRQQVNSPGTFPTRAAAVKELDKIRSQVSGNTYVAPSRLTVAEYMPTWLERRERTGSGLSAATHESYERYIDHDIVPSALGRMKLEDVRRHHLGAFFDQLTEDGRGAVTVRRIAAVLQGAFRRATRDGLIPTNPTADLGDLLPRVERHRFTPWTPEQVGIFLDTAAEHRLGEFFTTAVFTGIRRSALASLLWEDVDLENGTIAIRQDKTDAGVRTVRMGAEVRAALIAWQITQATEREQWADAWTDTGRVFTMEDGRNVLPLYLTRLFDKLRIKADLPTMTLHGLRHMAATLMLAEGVDLAIVSKRLGHSGVGITADLYAHLLASTDELAANAAAASVPRKTLRTPTAHTVHTHGPENSKEATPADA